MTAGLDHARPAHEVRSVLRGGLGAAVDGKEMEVGAIVAGLDAVNERPAPERQLAGELPGLGCRLDEEDGHCQLEEIGRAHV
jgi:hypothetical protein